MTQHLKSFIEERGPVAFPPFLGERVYMREFRKGDDLGRWNPTIDAMLDGVDTDGPIYLMIDQSEVCAETTHRRPGLHIDGYWDPGSRGHQGHTMSAHRSQPLPRTPRHHQVPLHRSHHEPGRHRGWDNATFDAPEAIILASDVSAARGLIGEFNGPLGEGGDASLVDTRGLIELPMLANRVYAGNVSCLHESLPVPVACRRTLVRLNVPGWSPEAHHA